MQLEHLRPARQFVFRGVDVGFFSPLLFPAGVKRQYHFKRLEEVIVKISPPKTNVAGAVIIAAAALEDTY